jgi:hypothetical protein
VVRTEGLEPSRGYPLRILSPVCLPVPPRPHLSSSPYRFAIRLQSCPAAPCKGRQRQQGSAMQSRSSKRPCCRRVPCHLRVQRRRGTLLCWRTNWGTTAERSPRREALGRRATCRPASPARRRNWRSRARAPHGHAKGLQAGPLQVAVRHTHATSARQLRKLQRHIADPIELFPRFLRVRYSALTAAADVPGA